MKASIAACCSVRTVGRLQGHAGQRQAARCIHCAQMPAAQRPLLRNSLVQIVTDDGAREQRQPSASIPRR
ncbi:hypothetical protein BKD09_24100 [Bradyrhizobium japonicum]|uniref:Uncharacterized protein n=1 Tax=Bradyrhizobium japonicum TaxID=375 RepID=A0A1L3FDQ8_BRAJP|nr:hypothetical protein BKD09_24100 [Bradyrhizobium japonicum]